MCTYYWLPTVVRLLLSDHTDAHRIQLHQGNPWLGYRLSTADNEDKDLRAWKHVACVETGVRVWSGVETDAAAWRQMRRRQRWRHR